MQSLLPSLQLTRSVFDLREQFVAPQHKDEHRDLKRVQIVIEGAGLILR